MEKLQDLLKSTRTVGVGECGFEYTDSASRDSFNKQVDYFERQLHLAAKLSLPVVIHSRGDDKTHKTTLTSLTNCLSSHHPIHWHCFTASEDIFLSAKSCFSKIVFGVTPFIFGNRYPTIRKIIQNHGITDLVLESDAPYIRCNEQTGNPYRTALVAEKIASIVKVPVESVLNITAKNAYSLYRKDGRESWDY